MQASLRKIVVCVKRVVDYNVRVRVKPDGSGVAVEGLKMSINPFDEIALEEALRIKERGSAEVVAVTLGTADAQQQLRTALAMGADRAVLIECPAPLEPLGAARALHALVMRESPDLVLLGKQAIDDDHGQTGQMLAALWDRPQATFASRVEAVGDATLRVTREVDGGLEVLDVDLPAVVTTDLRLNQPRYVKLPEILKAKTKPLAVVALDSLGIDRQPQFAVERTEPPPQRAGGIRVKDAAELVAALRQRGVL